MSISQLLSVNNFVRSNSEFRGSRTAFILNDRQVTWSHFDRRVSKVANALLNAGLRKGDKVALLGLNRMETLEILFGTLRAGGVIVPLSALLKPDMIAGMINDSESKFLFAVSPLEGLVIPAVSALTGVDRKGLIGVGFSKEAWIPYEDFINPASETDPFILVENDDDCSIIYSSGTTGAPKGIVHSHLLRVFYAYGACLEFRINSSATTVITTPLFTNATWLMLLGTMGSGGISVLLPKFTPEEFFLAVERNSGTHTFLVPTQYQTILESSDFGKHHLSSLRVMVSMGSTLPLPLKKRILEKMGPGLIELYGCTEGPASTLQPEDVMSKTGSVGRPIAGSIMRIIDDKGKELPQGGIGEIVGYTPPSAMKGYYNRPEATAEAIWQDAHGRPFIRTGDIGRFDEDGFLYILDRKKDMIVSGGVNVFASDIEGIFLEHPSVLEVAVIAVPHEKWIETPLALVRLRQGATVTEETLRDWVNARVAKHQKVSAVVFRKEEFPRNALGKLLKIKLREPYWEGR